MEVSSEYVAKLVNVESDHLLILIGPTNSKWLGTKFGRWNCVPILLEIIWIRSPSINIIPWDLGPRNERLKLCLLIRTTVWVASKHMSSWQRRKVSKWITGLGYKTWASSNIAPKLSIWLWNKSTSRHWYIPNMCPGLCCEGTSQGGIG